MVWSETGCSSESSARPVGDAAMNHLTRISEGDASSLWHLRTGVISNSKESTRVSKWSHNSESQENGWRMEQCEDFKTTRVL